MNLSFDLNSKVTITGPDSRIFRFNYQSANHGKFSCRIHVPDHREHTVMLQSCNDGSAFTTRSFNVLIPHYPPPPSSTSGNFS